MSFVIIPPVFPRVLGSAYVRSGLIFDQLIPSSSETHTCCDDVYNLFEFKGEKTIGKVHCHLSGSAIAGSPEKNLG